MLKIVVDIVFKLIGILGAVILTPLYAILTPVLSAFGFSSYIPYFLSFLDTAFTYVNWFVIALHIPLAPFLMLVSVSGVILTLHFAVKAFLLVNNIYVAVKGGGRKNPIGFRSNNSDY